MHLSQAILDFESDVSNVGMTFSSVEKYFIDFSIKIRGIASWCPSPDDGIFDPRLISSITYLKFARFSSYLKKIDPLSFCPGSLLKLKESEIISIIGENGFSVLERLISWNPQARGTSDIYLSHPYFKEFL